MNPQSLAIYCVETTTFNLVQSIISNSITAQ
jgi:hypothetical protein